MYYLYLNESLQAETKPTQPVGRTYAFYVEPLNLLIQKRREQKRWTGQLPLPARILEVHEQTQLLFWTLYTIGKRWKVRLHPKRYFKHLHVCIIFLIYFTSPFLFLRHLHK